MLASEHFTGSAKAGHDFVGNQENPVRLAPMLKLSEHALGPKVHSVGSLDEWFNDHRSECGRVVLFEFLERFDVEDGGVMLLESTEKQGDATEAGCAEGVAVVGARE